MAEMIKILIITDYFPQQNSIASLRPYSWVKYWSKMGHDVTVLTTTKGENTSDLNLDCSCYKIIEVENSFKTKLKKRFGNGSPENNYSAIINNKISLVIKVINKLKEFLNNRGILSWDARFPNLNDTWLSDAYKRVEHEDWDLTISTFAPYVNHLVAKKIKEQNKTKFWIADYRDLWTQNHIFKGLFPFTLVEEYLEVRVNNTADLITIVSEPLAKQIRKKYKLKNVETVENGFDFEDLENISKENFWSDDKVRLVYTGSIYKGKRDPSPLFEAISNIAKSNSVNRLNDFEVIFVGGSRADLDELITKYDVSSWVSYGGFLSREYSLRMQRDAHALIFLEFEASGIDGILTGKLFEYICSGTQILGIGVTDSSTPGELISTSGHGINFGKDSKKIEKYLEKLLYDNKKITIDKNTAIIEKYSRKAQAERILELFDEYG